MTTTREDAAADEFYERIANELYEAHKDQAVREFTTERLRSYYLKNPDLAAAGPRLFRDAKTLFKAGHFGPALVWAVTLTEVIFKGAVLRPLVYGLVHSDALADLVVQAALSQPGYKRYEPLLSRLFLEFAGIDLSKVSQKGSATSILADASKSQEIRNRVVHAGHEVTEAEASMAIGAAGIVMFTVWKPLLRQLGLRVAGKGKVVPNRRPK
jgi:hypothetical protein